LHRKKTDTIFSSVSVEKHASPDGIFSIGISDKRASLPTYCSHPNLDVAGEIW